MGSASRQMSSTLRNAAVRLFSPPCTVGVPMWTTKTLVSMCRAMFFATSAAPIFFASKGEICL